jgi:glycosyltransferase involved in cell wall biosynthesis
LKVALVHEFLTQYGGAERILENFHEMFPDAPVFTLVYDEQGTGGKFRNWNIKTSFLNTPAKVMPYKILLPLMPRAIEGFDFSGYDLVISDSSAFAKGIVTKKPAVHICYCHTPTRYLWESMGEYVANLPYNSLLKKLGKHYLKFNLKKWDYRASQRPDYMIANSKTVQERIKKYYGRDSEVVYPPVDTEFFNNNVPQPPLNLRGGEGELYFLTGSRLEPYKRIDLMVQAFNQSGLKLKVFGTGTELGKLKSMAKSNIEFLGRVSDEELRNLYAGAKAFIFPALEDAGISVLESLACGTPVIGLNAGGTAEFVRDGENGFLMNEQSIGAIRAAVQKLSTNNFDSQKIRESVLQYDKSSFKLNILDFINRNLSLTLSDVGEGRVR